MSLPQEWLLALLLVALYLHDGLAFTGPDTAYLARGPRGRWIASFPSRSFTFGGRHIFLPPQFPPATPLFRLEWQAGVAPRAAGQQWNAQGEADQLSVLCISSILSFLAVLMFVPLALVVRMPSAIVLTALGCAYFTVVASAVVLWARRRDLRLDRGQCAKLTAEMLLCPPVAANLVRRVSALRPAAEDFVSVARRVLSEGEWDKARFELERRIDEQLEMTEPSSPHHAALNALKAQLA